MCETALDDVYNLILRLSRGKSWLCDPDNILASLPNCINCLERNGEGIDAIGTEFKELMDRCGPTWSVQQNLDAISLANRFGYSFVVAGPTASGDSDSDNDSDSPSDDVSTATTTPPSANVSIVTMLVTSTPTPGSPGSSPTPTSTSPPPPPPPSSSSPSAATDSTSTDQAWIAGAVIGPVAALIIIIAVVWLLLRRRRRSQQGSHRLGGNGGGGGGGTSGKYELHANGIKQIVSAELRAEKRRRPAGPVELPGHVHYGPTELPVMNGDGDRKLAAGVGGWNKDAEK